jgi:hypothetical protein
MSLFTNGLPAQGRRLFPGLPVPGPFWSGLLGIIGLLPATYFMLAVLLRIFFGSATLYYTMSPSFLQSPFGIFAWHKAQLILCGAILSILINALTVLQFRLLKGKNGPAVQLFFRRYWLNTAVALQGSLLLIVLLAYTLIQHIRY